MIMLSLVALVSCSTPPPATPQAIIDDIRAKNNLPALGVAIVRLKSLPEIYVTGVRRVGQNDPVTVDDTWHLGSDTKAFTAALIASLVDQGKGKYDQRAADLLGIANPDETHVKTTLADLLGMRGNLEGNPKRGWQTYQRMPGTLASRRQAMAQDVFTTLPQGIKLGEFTYSNIGYALIGHIAEIWAGQPYEQAMEAKILKPLRIRTAAFGPNPANEPQPHIDGVPIVTDYPDNPPVLNPAGCLHMSLDDWSKWVQEVMLSIRGDASLLPTSYGERIRRSPDDGTYISGWIKLQRGWSKGSVYTHAGSNTMNYAIAWLAPAEGVAYLAVTNDGGKNSAKALDDAVSALIRLGAK